MSCDAVYELRRVENAGLPNIDFAFDPPLELSTSFSSIKGVTRLNTGLKVIKDAVIDNDALGIFHFEFDDDEIPAGVHKFEMEFTSLISGKLLIIPEKAAIRIDARERV